MTDHPTSNNPPVSRRYHLRHVTTYDYADAVALAHHDLCLQLRDLPYQDVKNASVRVEPTPDMTAERQDGFGNIHHFVAIESNHDALNVVAEATIDVRDREVPMPLNTPAWEQVRALVSGDGFPDTLEPLECSLASPGVSIVSEVTDYARKSFAPGRPILEAVQDFNHRIFTDFKYEPGATAVTTPVDTAFKARAGVCQDFAQIAIAGLRGLGLAARYVSGYIRTTNATQSVADPESSDDEGKAKAKTELTTTLPINETELRGADASHAWFAIWCGPEIDWVDLDPTNDLIVGTDHVVIGWGRDYLDISPVKGVILGGGKQELSVAVDLVPDDAA
ncbi:MAG: transglutaminase family protein [Alphaproteobacteria bacterium]|nr:transglutaminase family protein [Alphaproteobacteria bacterium SS10]